MVHHTMIKIVCSILSVVFIALFPLSGLSAEPLTDAFSMENDGLAGQLADSKEAVRYLYERPFALSLLPHTEFDSFLHTEYLSADPNVVVEAVFFLPLGMAQDKALLFKGTYNTLRSVSSLRGIEYYSVSHKKMRVFFKEAYMVRRAGDAMPMPDPLVAEIPSLDTLTIFQEDTTFGKSYSIFTYRAGRRDILVSIQNLTDLKYGPFRLIEKGGMSTQLLIRPVDEGLLFYGVCSVKIADILGLAKSRSDSFYNRIAALYSWFIKNLPSHL